MRATTPSATLSLTLTLLLLHTTTTHATTNITTNITTTTYKPTPISNNTLQSVTPAEANNNSNHQQTTTTHNTTAAAATATTTTTHNTTAAATAATTTATLQDENSNHHQIDAAPVLHQAQLTATVNSSITLKSDDPSTQTPSLNTSDHHPLTLQSKSVPPQVDSQQPKNTTTLHNSTTLSTLPSSDSKSFFSTPQTGKPTVASLDQSIPLNYTSAPPSLLGTPNSITNQHPQTPSTHPTNSSNHVNNVDHPLAVAPPTLNTSTTPPDKPVHPPTTTTTTTTSTTNIDAIASFLSHDNLTSTPVLLSKLNHTIPTTTTQHPKNTGNNIPIGDNTVNSDVTRNLTYNPDENMTTNVTFHPEQGTTTPNLAYTNLTSHPEESTTNLTSYPEESTTNLTSHPEESTTNLTSHPEESTTNLTSHPEGSTTNLTSHPEGSTTTNLTSHPEASTVTNLTSHPEENLAPFLSKENLTSSSTPFKLNSNSSSSSETDTQPNKVSSSSDNWDSFFSSKDNLTSASNTSDNLDSFLSKDNITSASTPFRLNTTKIATDQPGKNSNLTNTVDDLASFLSKDNVTSASTPFRYNKHNSTNDEKTNPSPLLDAMNATLTSGPFTYSNLSGNDTFDKDNATLVSTPFKYNLTHSGFHHLNSTDPSNATLAAIDPEKSNTTLFSSSPFQLSLSNGTHLLNSTSEINKDNPVLVSPLLKYNTTSANLSETHNATSLYGTSNSSNLTSTPSYHAEPKPAPAFVPVTSLFVNPGPAPAVGTSTPAPPVETAAPSPGTSPKKSSSTPFPSSWPRYIVPTNAPSSPPSNSTLVSILFTDALNWPWLVTNSNASSQVLVFMPQLIASTLQIPEDQVVTQSLQAYQPANFNPNHAASMLTLWLGYIPSQYVGQLQAMIRAPQSRFYTNPSPVLKALAKTVDPSLPISTYEKKTPASQAAANPPAGDDGDSSTTSTGQKIAVIASVTTCGAAILAIGLVIAARQSRRRMVGRSVPGSAGSSSLRIGAPMIGTFQRGHDGLPVPVGAMEQRGASAFVGTSAGGNGGAVAVAAAGTEPRPCWTPESPTYIVRHEYGEARTTSMVQPAPSGAHDRTSWWGRMSGILGGGQPRQDDHTTGYLDNTNLSLESAVDNLHAPHSPTLKPPRKPQITRGADGLVSGIGRPVMKENSLFF
ncbi:hypothetical protein PCASD_25858 [Puccinia coronata f. sp. avenae]|uniref:Mid2 domain-containing protein n=1 Tax=Puccinia coronata f. sp. avenae TaxID=200324 RepID=A0A2N5RX28_9BASI|nr:hypothetical protein PCASD_25858 [Puccinia coronata f. sp. avenae]